MNPTCLIVLCLTIIQLTASKSIETDPGKPREKRTSILSQLDKSDVVQKRSTSEGEAPGKRRLNPIELKPEAPEAPAETAPTELSRVKKQSGSNLCDGSTACGPLMTAQGPAVAAVRNMMQSSMVAPTPGQSRTFDIGYSPIGLGGFGGYGNSASSGYGSSGSSGYGNSLIYKPPAPVPVNTGSYNFLQSLQSHPLLKHPLLQHPLFNSFDGPKFSELYFVPSDFRQPLYVPQSFDASTPFVCQPLKNTQPQELLQDNAIKGEQGDKGKIEPAEKEGPPAEAKSADDQVRQYQKNLDLLKESLLELSRAAHRILDTQEKMATSQSRHNWRSAEQMGQTTQGEMRKDSGSPQYGMPAFLNPFERSEMPPYYGGYGGYGNYGGSSYGKSNAANYPQTPQDINFFIKLLKTIQESGLMSNSFQPSIIGNIPIDNKQQPQKQQQQQGKVSEGLVDDLVNGNQQQQAQPNTKPGTGN